MQDRNVEFPNRFRMVKVEGTDDIYDMIPAPGDVLNPGTLLNKANLLTDEVAQKMGLAMADPRPIDMFGVLADAGNIHVWAFVDSSGNKDFRVSVNRNAYQEGTSGGTTITYLGQLGDKVQIEVGSYVGTGTSGSANPTSITFDFAPKALIMLGFYHYVAGYISALNVTSLTTSFVESRFGYMKAMNTGYCKKSADGKTISWYANYSSKQDPVYQFNQSGETYEYIAIG